MELWDVLDENANLTGRTTVRGKSPLKAGEYHLVVHIWIYNDKKQLLIQQRSNSVEFMPGKWAITGGSVIHGEDSKSGAMRELKEEMGITAEKDELFLLLRVKRPNSFCDVWTIKRNCDIREITMQQEEVQAVKWVGVSDLMEMIHNGTFHTYPYMNEIYEFLNNL